MKIIYADGAYRGKLAENIKHRFGWDIKLHCTVTNQPISIETFTKRWVVERTCAWLQNYRRLAKNYEYSVLSSTAMIYLAFIMQMFHKINL
jgi:putative transposase